MSLVSSPKRALERTQCINTNDQPCITTESEDGAQRKYDNYEHAFKKIRTTPPSAPNAPSSERGTGGGLRKSPNKWTKEENQKLAALVAHYGEKKWKRISAEMGGQKTGAQCAQHWKRVLSPEIRKGHWDEVEEDLLLRLVVQYGSCWKKIAKKIPQRTDIQCRYQYLKAKQSREVKWDTKEDESLIKKVLDMGGGGNYPSPHFPSDPYNPPHYPRGASSSLASLLSPPPTSSLPHMTPCSCDSSNCTSSVSHLAAFAARGPLSQSGNSYFYKTETEEDKENYVSRLHGRMGLERRGDEKGMMRSSSGSDTCSEGGSSDSGGSTPSGKPDSMRGEGEREGFPAFPLPPISHSHSVDKIVWLEVAEHMARMKLTSTLRTALECKQRFMELLGSSTALRNSVNLEGASNGYFDHKTTKPFPPPTSTSPSFPHNITDTNISININNHSDHNNNNITITNSYSHNITINITNNKTLTDPKGPPSPRGAGGGGGEKNGMLPVKTELPFPSPPQDSKKPTLPSLPPFPAAFPAFPHHFPPVAQPLPAPAKPPPHPHPHPPSHTLPQSHTQARSSMMILMSGLDSLAAVASTLPREMLPPIELPPLPPR